MADTVPGINDNDIRRFQEAIVSRSRYNFNDYSVNSLKRRVLKILEDRNLDMDTLISTIVNNPEVLDDIVQKLTVHTTGLFRDPAIWTVIMLNVLPRFRKHSSIRIWHAGCSTGEEVYSMMIMLDQLGMLGQAEICASDINEQVLQTAREGKYRLRISREYLDNFKKVFSAENAQAAGRKFAPCENYITTDASVDSFRMSDFLREKPRYKVVDLVRDDNVFHMAFDLVVCRNVIIYFNYSLQNKVLQQFHNAMRNNGVLVLGAHESIIGPQTSLFLKNERYYIRKSTRTHSVQKDELD
jgi:chemotaxis protein methyltransferase CheR